jgi:hypothetical protein
MRHQRPSPALVIALLALSVALAGGAYASGGLVTSATIKNGTVQEVDLSPALRAKVRAPAPPGPAGPQGPQGPAGPSGTGGALGTEIISAQSEYAAGSGYRSANAICPPGKRVTGGGAAVEGVIGPTLTISRPRTDVAGWTATGLATTNFGAWAVTSYVVCADG